MFENKTALVTGANSGLGFEAAAQLAEEGAQRVILVCRTLAKAKAAREELVQRTSRDVFDVLAADMGDGDTVRAAVAELVTRGGRVDLLLLNAGLLAGRAVAHTASGIELTVAATLTGHHVLTTGLLGAGVLADDARIVISGSEAARGDVPMMGLTDVPAFADAHFEGDRVRAITSITRAEAPYLYANTAHYGMAKLFVAWWGAALARRLPSGVSVYVVSPGSTPSTGAMRNQPWIVEVVVTRLLAFFGPWLGLGMPVSTAARRYLDAATWGPERSGRFYASAPGKMVGPVEAQVQPHVLDETSQEALWSAVVDLTGAEISTPLRAAL